MIQLLTFLITSLPSIITAIMSIEKIFGKSMPGLQKKQLLLNTVLAADPAPNPAHVTALSTLVDLTVGTMKASGTMPASNLIIQPATDIPLVQTGLDVPPPVE